MTESAKPPVKPRPETLDERDAKAALAKWRANVPIDGDWHRVRLVTENGVRGWVLEKLTMRDGKPFPVRLRDPDGRDIVLGQLIREVELAV